MAAKFTLTLNFSEDEEESVKYINQALSGIMLSDVNISNSNTATSQKLFHLTAI